MPRTAKRLRDYLSRPATVLPEPMPLENFVQNIQERHKRGGSTSSFYFGDAAGQNLYAVSVYPDRTAFIPGRQIPSTLLRTFIQANRALLEDARNAVGTWYNREEDITYLDITTTLPDRDEAISLATRYNQIAIYDLAGQVEIATDGTGEEIDGLPPLPRRLAPMKRGGWDKTMTDTTKTEVTTTVIVADLIPSNPPAIMTTKRAVNSQGIARHLTQKVSVTNPLLAQRLFSEVQRGDEVTLTLTTTWTADSYETLLTDFSVPVKRENSTDLVECRYASASSG